MVDDRPAVVEGAARGRSEGAVDHRIVRPAVGAPRHRLEAAVEVLPKHGEGPIPAPGAGTVGAVAWRALAFEELGVQVVAGVSGTVIERDPAQIVEEDVEEPCVPDLVLADRCGAIGWGPDFAQPGPCAGRAGGPRLPFRLPCAYPAAISAGRSRCRGYTSTP